MRCHAYRGGGAGFGGDGRLFAHHVAKVRYTWLTLRQHITLIIPLAPANAVAGCCIGCCKLAAQPLLTRLPCSPAPLLACACPTQEANLRVQGHERVFALGDVSGPEYSYEDQGTAAASSSSLPATAQVAFQQADYVAWNLWAAVNGRALLPFRWAVCGGCCIKDDCSGS